MENDKINSFEEQKVCIIQNTQIITISKKQLKLDRKILCLGKKINLLDKKFKLKLTKCYQSVMLILTLIINLMTAKKSQKIATKASKKGVYNKYDREDRLKLISMVQDQGRTLASSAKELGICQTTARLIMSTWREEGRVFQKKSERAKRQRREQKKRAQQKRKAKSQTSQEDEDRDNQAQNFMAEHKVEENEVRIQNGQVEEDGAHLQITENAEIHLEQHLTYPMQYQLVQINGMIYLQPVFYPGAFMSTL